VLKPALKLKSRHAFEIHFTRPVSTCQSKNDTATLTNSELLPFEAGIV
jgi:hypothetical protein